MTTFSDSKQSQGHDTQFFKGRKSSIYRFILSIFILGITVHSLWIITVFIFTVVIILNPTTTYTGMLRFTKSISIGIFRLIFLVLRLILICMRRRRRRIIITILLIDAVAICFIVGDFSQYCR